MKSRTWCFFSFQKNHLGINKKQTRINPTPRLVLTYWAKGPPGDHIASACSCFDAALAGIVPVCPFALFSPPSPPDV